jgi:hypothetical protein
MIMLQLSYGLVLISSCVDRREAISEKSTFKLKIQFLVLKTQDFRCVASHRFGDRGHDCLGPCDFRYIVTAHGELRCMTVPPGAPNIATSRANRGSPHINCATPPHRNPNIQDSERLHEKGCWPHPRIHSLSRSGPGATVGTLRTRYSAYKLQVRTKDKAGLRVPRPRLSPPGSGQLQGRCVSPRPRLSPPSSGQLRGRRLSPRPSSRLPAWDSSGAAMCHLAPTLAFWLRAAPELPHVPRTGSTGCKQLNKYPRVTRPSSCMCAYLPRHYVIRAAPHVCNACSRRPIKCQ